MSRKLTPATKSLIRYKVKELNRLYSDITVRNNEIAIKMRTSVEEAIQVGEILTELKKLAGHGGWMYLFDEKILKFSIATAQNYMNTYKAQLKEPEKFLNVRNLSQAYTIIHTKADPPKLPVHKEEEEEEPTPEPLSMDSIDLIKTFKSFPDQQGYVIGFPRTKQRDGVALVYLEKRAGVYFYAILELPKEGELFNGTVPKRDDHHDLGELLRNLESSPEFSKLNVRWWKVS